MGIKNKADLLLTLLYASEDNLSSSIEGITRLEKLIFLLKKEASLLENMQFNDDFHFIPFRMGPYTQEVYDEVDFLESLGLVTKKSNKKSSPADQAHNEELFSDSILDQYQKTTTYTDNKMETFKLTEHGEEKAKKIWESLSLEEKNKIINIKKKFNRMNLKQFLRYVYKKYPEYTTESEIKDSLGL